MGFSRLKIRTRIFIGFGTLVGLILVLAGIGLVELSVVGSDSISMAVLADHVGRSLDATNRLEAIRRIELSGRLDGDAASLAEANDHTAILRGELAAAAQDAVSDVRRRSYASLLTTVDSHTEYRSRFIQLIGTAKQAREKLLLDGEALASASGRLNDAAHAANDPSLSAAAVTMNEAIVLVRLAAARFMATPGKDDVTAFHASLENFGAATAVIRARAPADVAVLISRVETALANYANSFDAFSAAKLASDDLYENQMLPQIKTMQKTLGTAAGTLKAAFDAANAHTASTIATANWLQPVTALAALVTGAVLALVIGRGIALPIGGMTLAMGRLAAGDRTVEVPGRNNHDEIGDMARAVEVFKHDAITKDLLEQQQAREQALRTRRQEEIGQLVGFFGRSIGGVFGALAVASNSMTGSSASLETASSDTSAQATSVLAEVEQTSGAVQSVAAASQELSASIGEISRQATESERISTAAMQQSAEVVDKVGELREAADQIGTVVELINSIARQTNLLALNATIEAARAGDAGKGFAVVASEVKSLAAQTTRATEQIGSQIGAIQAATVRAADAIQGIAGTVRQVNEIATSIAGAVVQQTAATQEIARSVELVSGNAANVAASMERVQLAVTGAGATATEVRMTATTLAAESGALSDEVKDFLSALDDLSEGAQLLTYEINAAATATLDGHAITGRVIRMSPGSAVFAGPLTAAPGTSLALRIDGFASPLRVRFVGPAADGVDLQLPLSHESLASTAQTLVRLGPRAAA